MINPHVNPRQFKGEGISRIDEVEHLPLEDPKQSEKQIQNQQVNTDSGEQGEKNLPSQPYQIRMRQWMVQTGMDF